MKTLPLSTFFPFLVLAATCALQVPTPVRAEDERKRDDPFEINNPHDLTFPGRRRGYEYSRMKAWLNDLGVEFVKIPLRRKTVEKFTEGKTVYDWSRPDLFLGTLPHDADVLLTLSGVDSDGDAPWGAEGFRSRRSSMAHTGDSSINRISRNFSGPKQGMFKREGSSWSWARTPYSLKKRKNEEYKER